MTTCPHKVVYLDEDETKCRVCSQSLTFPARPPGLEDEKDRRRDARIIAGESHRRYTRVEVEQDTQASTQLLKCFCCKELLSPENFYANNSPTARNRAFRSWRCRNCASFRSRTQRAQNPEAYRLRDRTRRTQYQESLTVEQKQQEKERRNKTGNAAAQTRRRARQDGIPVPLQRPGRNLST